MQKMEELEFPVPWGHIAGVAWGRPQDKQVLVVHGMMDNAGSFTRLVKLLPGNYYYVAIDLPGHGKSSHYPQGMNLQFLDYTLALRYVLDELKWEKCLYIGHSFAGPLGIVFSTINPGRLERIVAIDALLPKIIPDNELLNRIKLVQETTMFASKRESSTLYTKEQIIETLQTRRTFPLSQEAAEAIFDRGTTKIGDLYKFNRDSRLRSIVRPYFNKDQMMAIMEQIDTPILLILAKHSWYDVAKEREFLTIYQQKLIDTMKTVIVEGNHDVHNNDPAAIVPHISEFLKDLPREPVK